MLCLVAGICHWRELPQIPFSVATNTSFVATIVSLSRQNLCRDKIMFVATKVIFVVTKDVFVAISIFLSRQKTCFVSTKMILMAATANDRNSHFVD